MTRSGKKAASPTLSLTITEKQVNEAKQSNSGGCLIADAIKDQYPHLSSIQVDMATIRVTDREKGERYIYLTPPTAQHVLLSFDQGWPNPSEQVIVRRAVQIIPVTTANTRIARAKKAATERPKKIAALQQKAETGTITTTEKKQLGSLLAREAAPPTPPRPTSRGPVEVIEQGPRQPAVVLGGEPLPQGPAHPNLLRGRNRHFGAKLADPGVAFAEAVEAAVAERLGSLPFDVDHPATV